MDSSGHLHDISGLIEAENPEKVTHSICERQSQTDLKMAIAWFFDTIELAAVSLLLLPTIPPSAV
jgi:hypothetical protein